MGEFKVSFNCQHYWKCRGLTPWKLLKLRLVFSSLKFAISRSRWYHDLKDNLKDQNFRPDLTQTPSLCSLSSTLILFLFSPTFIKGLIMLLDFDHRFIKCLNICPLNDSFWVIRCIQKGNSSSSMGVIWRSLTSAISSLTGLITTLVFQAPNLLNCVCQGQLGCPKLILKA